MLRAMCCAVQHDVAHCQYGKYAVGASRPQFELTRVIRLNPSATFGCSSLFLVTLPAAADGSDHVRVNSSGLAQSR